MLELIRTTCGENSAFYKASFSRGHMAQCMYVTMVLDPFISYVENGLFQSLSWEREIQLDTVSDYLSQAHNLLTEKGIHPAAPAVLIGASLEEFLRTWLEALDVDISQVKQTIAGYTQELKQRGHLNKQDLKDITSWAGTRNDAAHGRFDEVDDPKRIRVMLEGVDLFIRKYADPHGLGRGA